MTTQEKQDIIEVIRVLTPIYTLTKPQSGAGIGKDVETKLIELIKKL